MRVLIGGGSGFIGQCLTRYLIEQGFEVVILARHGPRIVSPHLQFFSIDLLKPELFDQRWFDGVEAVVNLSGKNIFTYWNEKNKREILETRVTANKNLIDLIARLQQKPKIFISASAVGYYGNKGEAELDESASHGTGFLADVCVAWEAEAKRAEQLGMRSVQVRTAPVLERHGGMLSQLLKSFHFGFTFRFGSGNNWFSWIHMDDVIRVYQLAITDETLSGPINACSPNPVRFKDFLNHLREFKRALVIPFPVWILKIFLRETADVVLYSQKMVPAKLLKRNYRFSYPGLRDALREIFSP